MLPEDKRQRIKELVCEIVEADPVTVQDDVAVKGQNSDSLSGIEILAALEKEFNQKLPPERFVNARSLNNLYAIVEDALTSSEERTSQ